MGLDEGGELSLKQQPLIVMKSTLLTSVYGSVSTDFELVEVLIGLKSEVKDTGIVFLSCGIAIA